MRLKCGIIMITVASLIIWGLPIAAEEVLVEYEDSASGFSLQYPRYWKVVTDVDSMIPILDADADLVREEELSQSDRDAYKVLVHVDGNPRYLSNVVVLCYAHNPDGRPAYDTSEEAVESVAEDFDRNKASGTYLLQEIYLGESRTVVYRRELRVGSWRDSLRITYYLTASRTHAYMLVETVLASALDSVTENHFNQVVQSFRVTANESGTVDPSLGWGEFKPGEEPIEPELEQPVGLILIEEDFEDNVMEWPEGDQAELSDGRYVLDSRNGYPFTVTTVGLGEIEFDFSYEAEVEFLGGDESSGYGLVFAYRDKDNYMAFLVAHGGAYLVVEERNGEISELIPWTAYAFMEGEDHTLMVQGDYQRMSDPDRPHRYVLAFCIDGNEVGRLVTCDVLDVSGGFGVFVSEGVQVAYDRLVSRNRLLSGVMTLQRYEYESTEE